MTKFALLSVFDKTDIEKVAEFLVSKDYTLLSSGGTAKYLTNLDIPVTEVSKFTGSPELLDGRVKTLHPKIHGSILQKDLNNKYQNELVDLDVVICNLYPFEHVLEKGLSHDELMENIDIGGITLLRASGKNHHRVYIISNPSQYGDFIKYHHQYDGYYMSELATQAFLCSSLYDSKIMNYLSMDGCMANYYYKFDKLKYGTNAHQKNAYCMGHINSTDDVYKHLEPEFEVLNGSLGYINYLDAYGAWNLVSDIRKTLDKTCATSFKHTSPAGVSINNTPLSSSEIFNYQLAKGVESPSDGYLTYVRARNCDPKSSFGDFVAINTIVDYDLAMYLKSCVSDGIVATEYTWEALEVLKTKKDGNYVILKHNDVKYKQIGVKDYGGFALSQDENNVLLDKTKYNDDTVLGMTTLKYTQSNSTCFVYDNNVIGIGAGQQNRVDCVCLARMKAFIWLLRYNLHKLYDFHDFVDANAFLDKCETMKKTEKINFTFMTFEKLYHCDLGINDLRIFKNSFNDLKNLTLCSDGFFPFSDSVEEAQKINVNDVVHPGGSVSDDKIDKYCTDNNIKCYKTGIRYFYH
jgi:phosphoribosylaminoimidazolecarboxamide formyltransferase / IMP cyclohydrolase